MKEGFFSRYITGVATGATIVAISVLITYQKDKNSNELKHFDKQITSSHQTIEKADYEEKKIQFTFDGKPIYNFGTYKVELWNFTGKNIENVKVYIEVEPTDDDSLTLIPPDVFGVSDLPEAVEPLKEALVPSSKRNLKFGYLIPIANQSEPSKPLFTATLPVISKHSAKVTVTLQGHELDSDPLDFSWDHYNEVRTSVWERNWAMIFYFCIGIFLIIVIEVKFLTYLVNKRDKRKDAFIKKEITEAINKQKLNLNGEEIMKKYSDLECLFAYEDASDFRRWLLKIKQPAANVSEKQGQTDKSSVEK